MPTGTATETNLGVDTAGSPYAYFFASLGGTPNDTLYVVDSNSGATGGIFKYSLVNGSYVATGSVADPGTTSTTETYGLSATVVGGLVDLYATTPAGIYSVIDASGYDGALTGSLTQVIAAPTNTFFRGIVATTATPEPASLGLIGLIGAGLVSRRRRA